MSALLLASYPSFLSYFLIKKKKSPSLTFFIFQGFTLNAQKWSVSFIFEECVLRIGFSFWYGLKEMIVLMVRELDPSTA